MEKAAGSRTFCSGGGGELNRLDSPVVVRHGHLKALELHLGPDAEQDRGVGEVGHRVGVRGYGGEEWGAVSVV